MAVFTEPLLAQPQNRAHNAAALAVGHFLFAVLPVPF
jgi:hypothetical protein